MRYKIEAGFFKVGFFYVKKLLAMYILKPLAEILAGYDI